MSTINVRQTERWVSTLGGAALLVAGARRFAGERPGQAALLSAVGASLMWRGQSGHSRVYELTGINTADRRESTNARLLGRRAEHAEVAVSIAKRPDELYRVWRRFENLPQFLPNVTAVEPIDHRTSRWTGRGPGRKRVQWVSRLVNDVPNELIAWTTVDADDFASTGSIRFLPEPGGRGTIVSATLQYNLTGGKVGTAIATVFGKEPSQVLHEGLRRFKQIMEAGEAPTTTGQPRGGR